jgi:fructose-1,6-bisphosphatase/inositol monophosphatase family enzyme
MDEYLAFAKDLARQAGVIMLEHFKVGVEREMKSDATPVTIADKKINKLVIDSVASAFPGHSVLGEEENSDANNTEYIWVCDPIDGTIAYTLGIPTNLFSLALVHNGESILGILYDPYTERLYEATKSNGAYLNGSKIRVNSEVSPPGFITLPFMQYGITDTAALAKDVISAGFRCFSVCSVTYESMLVASGQTVATIFSGKTPWDIAAVKIIVEEAGGTVTDLYGNEQKYDQPIAGAIVSNGVQHNQLVALIKKHITA